MNTRNRSLCALASVLALFAGPSAEAQCTNIIVPGHTTGSFTSITSPVHAQTFVPVANGTVCEIRHGVDTRGGMTAYDLYVVNAPGTGAPPTDYTTTNLFSALGQTSFNTLGGSGINGKVLVTSVLNLNAGQRYALIIAPIGGQMAWRGNNGNPYPPGQGWFRSGASWVSSVPADFTFRILAPPPAPNNDNCNTSQPIGLGTVNGTTVGATTDGASACGGVNDVWYRFTAPCSGTVVANTCTATFDTVLSVHTACGGVEVDCNDDCPGNPCTGLGSCVAFSANCGVQYWIRVASFSGSTGTFSLTLSQPVTGPPNNNIASAIPVGNVTNLPFSTCGATTDGPGPCPGLNDVWYTYTPSCQGAVSIDLCGSSYDTYLAVYTGLPGNLTLVPGTCNDDYGPACAGLQSSVSFPGNPCATYYIRVGGYGGQTGCGDMTISCSTSIASNDQCSGALSIGPGLTFGSTTGATPSVAGSLIPGPCGASANTRDVWYSFTPACSGQLTIDTCGLPCIGGRYDTVLGVYTGSCGGPLSQVACNDDASCGSGYSLSSRVVTNVTGGVNYKIRVSGFAGNAGNFALQLGFVQPALANDSICTATPVACGTTSFSTCGATTSPEPSPGCNVFNDVWYSFTTPNCGGTTTIDTCGSPFNTSIAVYSGPCASPAFIDCNDDAPPTAACAFSQQSSVSFNSAANTTYFVRVGGAVNGTFGNGVLTIDCPPAAPACPPATGPALTSLFQVMGFASGTPWAFRVSIPCCFDLYVPNVPGVATTGTQSTDEANLRDAFVAAINAACPAVPPIATAYPYNGSTALTYGLFGIKARHCGTGFYTSLSVGPAFTPPAGLCTVVGSALPTVIPCSFNPEMVEVQLAGTDCNGNGEDDYIDILSMTSTDANGDNVPDECQAPGSGNALCFGDGSGTPCPCGNIGKGGNGCANSVNPNGALLTATGMASVTADSLGLSADGTRNDNGLFFQGNNAIAGGNGQVFGDGLRCCGGGVVRIQIVNPPGTTSPATHTMTETVTTNGPAGTILPGQTKCYQLWYRDPGAGSPCGNSFNLSNGVSILWQP